MLKVRVKKNVVFDISSKIEKLVSENGTSSGGLSKAFKFGTGETFAGRGIRGSKGNNDDRNFFSTRENNERAKPRYLYGR